jgi:hypothetical protein
MVSQCTHAVELDHQLRHRRIVGFEQRCPRGLTRFEGDPFFGFPVFVLGDDPNAVFPVQPATSRVKPANWKLYWREREQIGFGEGRAELDALGLSICNGEPATEALLD